MTTTDRSPTLPTSAPTPAKPPGASWPLDYEGEFNVPVLGIGITILMGAGTIYQKVEGAPVHSWWIAAALAVVIAMPCGLLLWEQYRDIRFRKWILAHWADIASGRATLEGVRVGPETEFIQYRLVVSILLMYMVGPSRPVLPETRTSVRTRRLSTLITGLAGWWSFWGVFRTLGALTDNFTNKTTTVRMQDIANAVAYGRPLHQAEVDS